MCIRDSVRAFCGLEFSSPFTKNVAMIEAISPHPEIASGNNTPSVAATPTPSVRADTNDPTYDSNRSAPVSYTHLLSRFLQCTLCGNLSPDTISHRFPVHQSTLVSFPDDITSYIQKSSLLLPLLL